MAQQISLGGMQAESAADGNVRQPDDVEIQQASAGRKPWYLSKGFVGPLVSAILFSLRSLGIVDLDDQTVLSVIYQASEFIGIIVGMVGQGDGPQRLVARASAVPDEGADLADY